jgi:hypothetical protein
MKKQTPRVKPKASREAFFVRIDAGDGKVAFFDATEHVGKVMPFRKPQATCAMRVSEGVVSFSLLHMTKKTAATLTAKPVELPRGPLARLERRGIQFSDLVDGEIVVEITERIAAPYALAATEAPDAQAEQVVALADLFSEEAATDAVADASLADLFSDATTATTAAAPVARARVEADTKVDLYRLQLRRDENGVATIEDPDEVVLELPKAAVRLSVYFRSPSVPRVLAIGFIGHLGRPGNTESVARLAGLVLNSLSHLTEFRLLANIETVALGASPAKPVVARVRSKDERAQFMVRGYFFDESSAPLGQGDVQVEVDLEHANPTSGRLLCAYTPEVHIAEVFESYRSVFDAGVGQALRAILGDDGIEQITFDIVLGGVDLGAIEQLREVGGAIGGIDCTPTQFRQHS